MSVTREERNPVQYLGLSSATGRHPTDHPFRGPPLDPTKPRPLGNWVIVLTVLPLPLWTYFLLRYNVFGGSLGGKEFGFNTALVPSMDLVDSFSQALGEGRLRPGNVMVLDEALTAWMMASPLLLRQTNARMTITLALTGAIFHIGFATICNAVFTYRVSRGWQSSLVSRWPQYLSLVLVLVSSVGESWMDWRKRCWKDDPGNKGKVFDQAGFNLSRHPKHVCFIIYRSLGIALATGSPYTTLVMLAFQMNYFVGTVVPEIEGYMAWKYGEKWEAYTKEVVYKLVPCVY